MRGGGRGGSGGWGRETGGRKGEGKGDVRSMPTVSCNTFIKSSGVESV